MRCPECRSSATEVLEVRRPPTRPTRRRHSCRSCGSRWTSYEGDVPRISSPSPEEVRRILLDSGTDQAIARRAGRCVALVKLVRRGEVYGELWPEIPREVPRQLAPQAYVYVPAGQDDGPSCLSCQHWTDDRCGMGFPDPSEEGPGFAADCSLYAP